MPQQQNDSWIRTYGTIGGGMETMCLAWPALEHIFATRRPNTLETQLGDDVKTVYPCPRFPVNILRANPVDLLTIENGHLTTPLATSSPQVWERAVSKAPRHKQPRLIIEMWPGGAGLWANSPTSKPFRSRWAELGYVSRSKRVVATKVGGAISQVRFVVARVKLEFSGAFDWPDIVDDDAPPRAMSNLLTPPGLLRKQHFDPSSFRGTGAIYEVTSPMPASPGRWVHTTKGIRRLQPEEVANGLGAKKAWRIPATSSDILARTTSLFHWEFLSSVLSQPFAPTEPKLVPIREFFETAGLTFAINESHPFSWKPPDLSPGGTFWCDRVAALRAAAQFYPDPQEIIRDGLAKLDIHRLNYTDDGPAPQQLQLLWWEFKPEHWEDIRLGGSMNFLTPPEHLIQPNAAMDFDQVLVAAAFVNELIDLRVIDTPDEGDFIVTNAPLFVLPKEGQEGEWRVLADMLRGGQNAHVGSDPVILPRISHILDELYEGGFSAVVDASKMFYQFPTRAEDRKYLGILHPVTGVLYWYCGLPMGASNSPALAGRFGLSFLRKLREKHELFRGVSAKANCWWTGFSPDTEFDPAVGYGLTLRDSEGQLIVKLSVFVDDFLIHGPTLEATQLGLRLFLDGAVELGMLCHPKKLIPPTQVVKYCGFLLDSRRIPCLRIPVGKRERALGIVEHIMESSESTLFSRLSLAVAAGVLQSLVEATPRLLGSTYLRRFHSLVHPVGGGTGLAPYLTRTSITSGVRTDLQWWRAFLLHDEGRFARSTQSATLVPNWGDGSGTGTGGTLGLPNRPLRMWMGQWSPCLFSFTSNYKELATLLLTMEHIERDHAEEVTGTTLFYFTDNSVTYYIAAKGSSGYPQLHSLIEKIRLIELRLHCVLQVVHVPGVLMIRQGTDGLSRGIWASPLHNLVDSQHLTARLFAPVPFSSRLVTEYVTWAGLTSWTFKPWDHVWDAVSCFGLLTVWFPPPELARQLLIFLLSMWVEQARTTSALLFIPRIVPAFWHGLSRHIVEWPTIYPAQSPAHSYLNLEFPIPVVILYLGPHIPALPSPSTSMEPFPNTATTRWHRARAQEMRGLPPKPLQ